MDLLWRSFSAQLFNEDKSVLPCEDDPIQVLYGYDDSDIVTRGQNKAIMVLLICLMY